MLSKSVYIYRHIEAELNSFHLFHCPYRKFGYKRSRYRFTDGFFINFVVRSKIKFYPIMVNLKVRLDAESTHEIF